MDKSDDKVISKLNYIIKVAVKVLAVFMTFVILMGVIDVAWTVYGKIMAPPKYILTMNDMLATFGAFMAVLIAIEIFVNITIYLRDDIIHVKIVMATALMAVSRKVIILDMKTITPTQLFGLGVLVFALSIGYWLVRHLPRFKLDADD